MSFNRAVLAIPLAHFQAFNKGTPVVLPVTQDTGMKQGDSVLCSCGQERTILGEIVGYKTDNEDGGAHCTVRKAS